MTSPAFAKYVEKAIEHGRASEAAQAPKANSAYRAMMKELAKLITTPEGIAELKSALGHTSPWVRLWSASHLLQADPAAAVPVLEALLSLGGFIATDARMVLREWTMRPGHGLRSV